MMFCMPLLKEHPDLVELLKTDPPAAERLAREVCYLCPYRNLSGENSAGEQRAKFIVNSIPHLIHFGMCFLQRLVVALKRITPSARHLQKGEAKPRSKPK